MVLSPDPVSTEELPKAEPRVGPPCVRRALLCARNLASPEFAYREVKGNSKCWQDIYLPLTAVPREAPLPYGRAQ